MKRLSLLPFLLFFSFSLYAQKPLTGKVRVVSSFADYKVRVVSSFADLLVRKVDRTPTRQGEWQFVDYHEDFTIQFVSSHEDFTISYVSSFPGLPNGKSRLKPQPSGSDRPADHPADQSGSREVVVRGNEYLPEAKVHDEYFTIKRSPGRRFPINARVQFVCDSPDVVVYAAYPYDCNMQIPVSVFPVEESRQWLVVDTLPDFTIQMTSFPMKADIHIFFRNGYQPEVKERAYPAGGYGRCWK